MKQFSFYLMLLLLISCNKEDNIALNAMDPNMNLENLKVGQKFHYLLASGEGYEPLSGGNYEYTGDTLVVTVIKKVNNGYLLSEKLTDGSPIKLTSQYWEEDDYQNIWKVRNDSIVIEDYQNSFSFSQFMVHKSLPLQAFTDGEIEFGGKGFTYSHYKNAELYVKDYSLLDNTYDQLNVKVFNSGTTSDGPGITTVYSKEHGLVKIIAYDSMANLGSSWNRIK